jgi:thymidine phosphorylase
MEVPLGRSIGNALEIRECIDTLNGCGSEDLASLCVALAGRMLRLGGAAASVEDGEALAREALASGRALKKFRDVVSRQGGDAGVVDDPKQLPTSRTIEPVTAGRDGFVREMRADAVGIASVLLGAGRDHVDASIDPAAGIVLHARPGDRVRAGQTIAELHVGVGGRVDDGRARFLAGVVIGDEPPVKKPLIIEVVH